MAQSGELRIANNTYDKTAKHLYDNYTLTVGKASQILNGPEYYYDDKTRGGDPFFGTQQFHDGSVIYDGNIFENLDVGYDIFRDELFISDGIIATLKLPQEKVAGFSLGNNTFIMIQNDTLWRNQLNSGYYHLLYNGELKVLAKRKKKIIPSSDGQYRYMFEGADKLYVLKNNIFYPIRSKGALRKILADEKKPIREYYNENWLTMLEVESYVVNICQYYDFLKKN